MKELLFLLLRYAVCNNVTIDNTKEIEYSLPEIYKLAKKHDVAQVVSFAADKLGIKSPVLEREKALAILRVEKLKFASTQVCDVLEKAKIPHMLLKGAHLRALYPEDWVRTSCDVDVYVDVENLDKAADALEKSGFARGRRHTHDVMLTAPNGYTIELHFVLITEDCLKGAIKILSGIWENSIPETQYRYKMNDETFYFYHIAHMARHVKSGGCGIRPYLDLWLLCHQTVQNPSRQELCKAGGLEKFEETSRQLSEIWFSGTKHNALSLALEEYVISGEVYGKKQNAAAGHGAKLGYVLSRIFMPYSQLKLKYQNLDGKPYLMPVYTIKRWCNLLDRKTAKSSVKELKASASVSKNELKRFGNLLKNLGL